MKAWLLKKLLGIILTLIDSWGAEWLTFENGQKARAWIIAHTTEKVRKWNGKSKHWAKLRSDNGFVQFMTALMKSERLTDFRDEK